jgi:hypothetical protein
VRPNGVAAQAFEPDIPFTSAPPNTAKSGTLRLAGALMALVFPGGAVSAEPGISRFPDLQLHIRCLVLAHHPQ